MSINLSFLPDELVYIITQYLSRKLLLSLSQTAKKFRWIINHNMWIKFIDIAYHEYVQQLPIPMWKVSLMRSKIKMIRGFYSMKQKDGIFNHLYKNRVRYSGTFKHVRLTNCNHHRDCPVSDKLVVLIYQGITPWRWNIEDDSVRHSFQSTIRVYCSKFIHYEQQGCIKFKHEFSSHIVGLIEMLQKEGMLPNSPDIMN